MKRIGIMLMLSAIWLQVPGQETTNENRRGNQLAVSSDTNDNTKIVVGENLFSFEDSKEAVKVRVGNRGLDILESLEGPKFKFEKFQNENDNVRQDDNEEARARRRNRFKGHWAGVEFGFNNYLTADNSLVLPSDIYYMTLHSSKSNSFNINFAQHSIGFTRHIGLVTGLGINWNNYRFDGNNNITTGPDGIVEELNPGSVLEKSKLTTVYLTLPLMLELQIPADNHHLDIGGGFIGAVKIGSHSKMVYENKDKVKSNDDFSLNLLRYGPTARIGFENLNIYATYYMTPLFKTGKGPGGYDLYPFEIGFAFTFNN